MEIDLKQLRELMRAMKQLDVRELELELEGQRLYLKRGPAGETASGSGVLALPPTPAVVGSVVPPSVPPTPPAATSVPPPSAAEDGATYTESPFVGTVHRAPSPDADPFVQVGSAVSVGSVLCIVEAMKLMNEVEADVAGIIEEVLVENGEAVEYGDRLFKVKKA